MESFYKKVYGQAWRIISTNWYLLFFGIFVVALGLTGEFKAITALDNEDLLLASMMNWIEMLRALLVNGVDMSNLPLLSQTVGVLFFFAILLVLGISSQGALINATAQNQKNGKNSNQGKLAANLNVGVDNFWPLLGLNLLNKLISFVFVAGVIAPITYAIYLSHTPPMANFFVAIVLFFSFIPLSILISFVTRYGASFLILKRRPMITAFFDGWTLFRLNWLVSVEHALVISFLTGLYTIAIISLLALTATPFLILSYIVLQISQVAFWVIIFAGTLTAVIIFIIATSFYGTYYTVVWTQVFLKLTEKSKSLSKTERLIKKHVPFLAR